MKTVFSTIVFLLLISSTFSLKWKRCDSSKSEIENVSVTDCQSTDICTLKKEKDYTITIDFKPNEDTSKATSYVYGILEGIAVKFNLENPDVCKDSHVTCPIKKDEKYSYQSKIHVKKEYPSIRVGIKWEIKDENEDMILCIAFPAVLSN